MLYRMIQEYKQKIQPMSEDEFYVRNLKSQKDIEAGRIYSQEDLIKRYSGKYNRKGATDAKASAKKLLPQRRSPKV